MTATTANRYILLVDDDPDDRMLFEEALHEVNTDTRLALAFDGKHLLQYLQENSPPPPDVIFLDLNMPRMNGHECLEALKQNPEWSGIPVVIFSTTGSPDTIEQTYIKGATHYLRKPESYSLLKRSIEKVLSSNLQQGSPQPGRKDYVIEIK